MTITVWGHSDIGKKRQTNDDFFVVDEQRQIFIVADGARGVGHAAARMLASNLVEQLGTLLPKFQQDRARMDAFTHRKAIVDGVQSAFNKANEAVYQRAQFDESCKGMYTTATVLALMGHLGVLGHVGNSRAYMIRDMQFFQLTEDHTLLHNLLKRGALQPEQAATFPHRYVLDRAIGKKPTVEADVMVLDVTPGDRYLLCTKGITKALKNPAIHRAISGGQPQTAVMQVIQQATQGGAEDNATAIVIEVGSVQRSTMSIKLRAEEKVAYLRDVFLFQDLDFQEMLKLLHIVRELPMPNGQVLVREGDTGDEFYVIARGSAVVSKSGKVVGQIPSGGHCGELALLGDGYRTATVTASEDCLVLAIQREALFEILWRERDIGMKLMWRFLQNLAGVVKNLNEQLANR